jgi:hypothetical protein
MRQRRQPSGAGYLPTSILRRKLEARRIGRPSPVDVAVEGFAGAPDMPCLHQSNGHVHPADDLPTGNLLNPLKRDGHPQIDQLPDHLLCSRHSSGGKAL